MKLVMLCLLSAMAVLCFGYFLLGLLHLESLFLSGILFFTLIFLIVRMLTWNQKRSR
ncbi:hypothetical protein [Sporolactobacillus inulinus]|jgi:hypothetical protein|uniref:hypothetical protein n=1 Tax=Sporolactobacillus inulinus TaxID=2078 RepID=UPI00031C60AC|nr:hypothetical protein [Sporolactobacillus inulinus]GEB76548.1 hypothetical protein SIN01_08930 [Sporolactobacillus inulinus]